MKHLKTLTPDKLPYELAILTHVLEDKLFDAIGITTEMLDEATDELNLEEDEEYKQLIEEYQKEVSGIKLGQVGDGQDNSQHVNV